MIINVNGVRRDATPKEEEEILRSNAIQEKEEESKKLLDEKREKIRASVKAKLMRMGLDEEEAGHVCK